MAYDYSSAQPPREFGLIPHDILVDLQIKIQPGGAGEGGLLKRSKDGLCEMLHLELTVIEGQYEKKKLWINLILAGTTEGHEKAAEISRGALRQIVESARGIQPVDMSPQARALRTVELYEFDGLRFVGRIGVEKGKAKNATENYPDRNVLLAAITPDRTAGWHPIAQSPTPPSSSPASPAPASPTAPVPTTIARPTWAQ